MSERIKVNKKRERLARALLEVNLLMAGFPADRINDRVSEAWCVELDMARLINLSMNGISDWELDGYTTQANIDKWSAKGEMIWD